MMAGGCISRAGSPQLVEPAWSIVLRILRPSQGFCDQTEWSAIGGKEDMAARATSLP